MERIPMKMKWFLGALCATVAVPALAAPTLWISDSNSNLARVDVATGLGTVVGNTGTILTDIAFDSSGNLYGISFTNLYRVNTTSAALTLVGSLGLSGANALVFSGSGTLYAAANNTNNLYSVNTTTGAATSLGSTGFTSSGDLAFVGSNLFLAANTGSNDSLVSINLGPVSGSVVGSGMGVDDVFGMARGDDGILYGVTGNSIRTINSVTGTSAFLRSYSYGGVGQAFGTTFQAETRPAVPEPATWGTMLIGFAFMGAAMRRNKIPTVRLRYA
jgi:hypothetical protein